MNAVENKKRRLVYKEGAGKQTEDRESMSVLNEGRMSCSSNSRNREASELVMAATVEFSTVHVYSVLYIHRDSTALLYYSTVLHYGTPLQYGFSPSHVFTV